MPLNNSYILCKLIHTDAIQTHMQMNTELHEKIHKYRPHQKSTNKNVYSCSAHVQAVRTCIDFKQPYHYKSLVSLKYKHILKVWLE